MVVPNYILSITNWDDPPSAEPSVVCFLPIFQKKIKLKWDAENYLSGDFSGLVCHASDSCFWVATNA